MPVWNKSKLLHVLQYKTRPPVLDLDLFFKKCPDIVVSHDKINTSAALRYLKEQLEDSIKSDDFSSRFKYESLLQKYESMIGKITESDILSWLQYLSVCNSSTRVYGFWKDLKRYSLDPDDKFLVHNEICSICGGNEIFVRYVNSIVIDSIIIRSRSKFLVYDLGDGGG